jgi:hypothetical protein
MIATMLSSSSRVCTEANATLLNRSHRTAKRAAARTSPHRYGFIAHGKHRAKDDLGFADSTARSAGLRAQSDRSQ